MYNIPGATWEGVMDMDSTERFGLTKRLSDRLKKETASINTNKPRGGRKPKVKTGRHGGKRR
jgi:hypothetical protein